MCERKKDGRKRNMIYGIRPPRIGLCLYVESEHSGELVLIDTESTLGHPDWVLRQLGVKSEEELAEFMEPIRARFLAHSELRSVDGYLEAQRWQNRNKMGP
jgi:hypothetical protein